MVRTPSRRDGTVRALTYFSLGSPFCKLKCLEGVRQNWTNPRRVLPARGGGKRFHREKVSRKEKKVAGSQQQSVYFKKVYYFPVVKLILKRNNSYGSCRLYLQKSLNLRLGCGFRFAAKCSTTSTLGDTAAFRFILNFYFKGRIPVQLVPPSA